MESVFRDSHACLLRDDFETLHHSRNHLVLQAAVFWGETRGKGCQCLLETAWVLRSCGFACSPVLSLGVLSDGDQVDVVVLGLEPRNGHARPYVRVERELLPQRQVQAPVSLSYGRGHRTLGAFGERDGERSVESAKGGLGGERAGAPSNS